MKTKDELNSLKDNMSQFTLSFADIDSATEYLTTYMSAHTDDRKTILRYRLMLEEILLKYNERFGAEATFEINEEKRLGQARMTVKIAGSSYNPFDDNSQDELIHRMLSNAGLAPVWAYRHGCNCIVFPASKKRKLSDLMLILLAVVVGIVLGIVARFLPQNIISTISDDLLTPVSNTIMGFLSANAMALVFTSVISGICGMGDMATFSRVGKRMIKYFFVSMLLFSVLGLALILPFFKMSNGGTSDIAFNSLFKMVLDIIPQNLLTPFTIGNTIQVIFIAICLGAVLLVLNVKAHSVIDFINQCASVLQLLIEMILKLIPFVIFVSVFNIVVKRQFEHIQSVYKFPLLLLISCIVSTTISVVRVCVTKHVSPITVLTKMLPTMSITMMTASSSAAYSTNTAICKNGFGISEQLVDVGVPLGQVVFMPGTVFQNMCAALCMAEIYGIGIDIQFIITMFLISFLLAVACPPVPGASISCSMLIMAQLGIPAEAIAIIAALDFLNDRINTTNDIAMLQLELIQIGSSLDMLKPEVLKDTRT